MERLNKDAFFLIIKDLKLLDLLNLSKTSKYINHKISNSFIWVLKIREEFSDSDFLPEDMNPKEKYKTLYSLKDFVRIMPNRSSRWVYKDEILNLNDCLFTKIPRSIESLSLSNLKHLYFSGNSLKEIPDSIGKLSNLRSLSLSNNYLKKIPDTISNLFNLQFLYLSFNQLTEIPNSIGKLSNLKVLNLIDNSLTRIPDSIGSLHNLEHLYLSGNPITIYPSSLEQLPNLKEIYRNKLQKTSSYFSIGCICF